MCIVPLYQIKLSNPSQDWLSIRSIVLVYVNEYLTLYLLPNSQQSKLKTSLNSRVLNQFFIKFTKTVQTFFLVGSMWFLGLF